MRIISKSKLREFWEKHPDAKASLEEWYRITNKSLWRNFADVRDTFRSADPYCDCVIFNIKGNNYRLITIVLYPVHHVYVRFVLAHSEYDKGRWKDDCNC
ncbi:MAG: type II toxin-antitoxin system HigB family toxin [Blastocatellia bacterium]